MKFKKYLYGAMAVMLTGSLMFSSCTKEDNSATSDEESTYVDLPQYSTEDQLSTLIQRPTYVFNATYTGEGKAVVARATKKAELTDQNLGVVIMPSSQIKSLSSDDYLNIVRVLAKDGTVVFTEPILDELDAFCKKVSETVSTNSQAAEIVFENLPIEAIQRIIDWGDSNPFEGLIEGDVKDRYEIIALRAQTLYASMNDREGVATTQTMNVEVEKADKEGEFDIYPIEIEVPNNMDDNYFGQKADNLAEWLNSDEPETTVDEAAQVRAMIAHRAGENVALQSLTKAQTIILDGTNNKVSFTSESGATRIWNHPIKLRYDIWTAYSEEKKCDFYCVKLSVTAENDKLECGPSEAREWYNPVKCDYWQLHKSKMPWYQELEKRLFGPFMSELNIECSLDNIKAELPSYTPKNSTTGGETVAESFSYTLGASVGANGNGPIGQLSGSCTFGTSVSRFSPDLKLTVTASTSDGKLSFNYLAANPIAEFNTVRTAKHSGLKDISVKTCTVEHAWVWQVQSNASTVTLNTRIKSVDKWMSYYESAWSCHEVYFPTPSEHNFKSPINCPPRFKQEWAMTIEPTNTKAEAYLAQKLPQYFWNNNTFATQKEKHEKADNTDEISTWFAKSKDIFDKNTSILKAAAQEGGITQNFTIRWHQTNGTGGTDNDFTYEAKIKEEKEK